MKKTAIILFTIFFLVLVFGIGTDSHQAFQVQAAEAKNRTFIPLVNKPATKLVGMYFQGAALFKQESFDNLINQSKAWSGGKLSIIGTFMDADFAGSSDFNVVEPLRLTWENGYVPFINFEVFATAYEIAIGNRDQEIRRWADAYKNYALNSGGEQRFAFIAPLQEMNSCQKGGCWTIWGGNPANYKLAYRRIQQIFDQAGVPANSVRWVFAPNGWSHPQYDHPFEDYYPGADFVDVVAISAYNFGGCLPNAWQSPQEVYNNPNYGNLSEGIFLDRMRQLAPGKPIFIAQTGTAGSGSSKNSWLDEAHDYLASYAGVSAVLYFNLRSQCEWVVYDPPSVLFTGYVDGVTNVTYRYRTPQDIKDDPSFITK